MSTDTSIFQVLSATLDELRAIHRTLKQQTGSRQPRRSSTVNQYVLSILSDSPYHIWTAEALAKQIGGKCTSAAVRQTHAWKMYRSMLRKEKQNHRLSGKTDNENE